MAFIRLCAEREGLGCGGEGGGDQICKCRDICLEDDLQPRAGNYGNWTHNTSLLLTTPHFVFCALCARRNIQSNTEYLKLTIHQGKGGAFQLRSSAAIRQKNKGVCVEGESRV